MGLLRDRSEAFRAAGVQPYAISRDSPWTHIAWQQALDLNFPLLSDWNGDATRALGIAQDYRGFRDLPARSVFLVDATGVVRYARRYENDELPNLEEALSAATDLGA